MSSTAAPTATEQVSDSELTARANAIRAAFRTSAPFAERRALCAALDSIHMEQERRRQARRVPTSAAAFGASFTSAGRL